MRTPPAQIPGFSLNGIRFYCDAEREWIWFADLTKYVRRRMGEESYEGQWEEVAACMRAINPDME